MERRRYRRIQAPVFCRPAGLSLFSWRKDAIDVSLGGVRIYSDTEMRVGDVLRIEVFVEGGASATYTARVAWVERLPKDAPCEYDVGMEFLEMDRAARETLAAVLAPAEDALGSRR